MAERPSHLNEPDPPAAAGPARWLGSPRREVVGIITVAVLLGIYFVVPGLSAVLWIGAAIGALPTLAAAGAGLRKRTITIEAFNSFAVLISLALGEVESAAFIVLMLQFAALLDYRTQSRAHRAVEELLKLRPDTAQLEKDGGVNEVPVSELREGDIVVIEAGQRVPVDGVVTFGTSFVNESPVTGESAPVHKVSGDTVISSTLNESGVIKVRATRVGAESTVEKMAALVKAAGKHKSSSERLADRFAGFFLPFLLATGAVTYLVTGNTEMTAALFLIACADDMAVAIPLAMAAALGRAARRGVIIKGGSFLEVLGKMQALVLDKTGTLTYGSFTVKDVHIESGTDEEKFWRSVGVAEKYSEHPAGKAVFRKALEHVPDIPDAAEIKVFEGSGIGVTYDGSHVTVGEITTLRGNGVSVSEEDMRRLEGYARSAAASRVVVIIDGKIAGHLDIADVPRPEARQTVDRLKALGVAHVYMFTGDNEHVAKAVADELGITDFRSSMRPEDKLNELERLCKEETVAMVGDGVNDAPALAKAGVGIAMGRRGTEVAIETADVVILTDNLARIPEMVELSRTTFRVIRTDMAIWLITNAAGFLLVFTGVAGPALAALYNFLTDFLPIANSARLFRDTKSG